MSGRKKCVFCTAAAMSISFIFGGAAMAQETTIAFPYQQDEAWDEIALTNDETVSTGVNIRMQANEESPVVGCMYHGGAAWIINQGEEWTEVYSGGLTGFVKNEYLVSGEAAKAAAEDHGVEGVATTWSDVKLYSGADGGSEVLDSIEYGDSFILTQDEGHWLQVQRGADSTAYVSADDVSRVLLFDTAVATDESYLDSDTADDTGLNEAENQESGTDTWTDDSTDDIWTDTGADAGTDETWTGADAGTDDGADAGTDDAWTDTGADESTDDTWTDTDAAGSDSSETTDNGGSYYDAETGIYYDADTGLYYDSGTGVLYDAWWNPVNADIAVPPTFTADTGDVSSDYTDGSDDYTNAGTDDTWTDTGADESTDDTWTDTDAAGSDSSGTTDNGGSYYDAETGIYYDADTGLYYDSGTGVLYDAWWNPVNADIAVPPTFTADTGNASSDYTDNAGGDSGDYTDGSDNYTDDSGDYADDYTDDSGDYTDDYTDDSGDNDSAGSADDTSLLAALIYCEAGNQSYDGMVAVGAVVMNRVNSPSFPNSIREVIYQSGQFTPASSGWLDSALASGVPSTCYDAAAAAINGENPVGSALYFNTGSGKGTKLGDHQFY